MPTPTLFDQALGKVLQERSKRIWSEEVKTPRIVRLLGDVRIAENDGDLSASDLAAIDAEFAPKFIRQPEHDKRLSRGDAVDGNAWLEHATGKVRMFYRDFCPNAKRWVKGGVA